MPMNSASSAACSLRGYAQGRDSADSPPASTLLPLPSSSCRASHYHIQFDGNRSGPWAHLHHSSSCTWSCAAAKTSDVCQQQVNRRCTYLPLHRGLSLVPHACARDRCNAKQYAHTCINLTIERLWMPGYLESCWPLLPRISLCSRGCTFFNGNGKG